MAEKYPYNSTYAFQENKMGLGRELEGLELEKGPAMPNIFIKYAYKGLKHAYKSAIKKLKNKK